MNNRAGTEIVRLLDKTTPRSKNPSFLMPPSTHADPERYAARKNYAINVPDEMLAEAEDFFRKWTAT